MKIRSLRTALAALACSAALTAPAPGIGLYTMQDQLPLQNNHTVATCYSSTALANLSFMPLPDPNGNVVVVWDTTPSGLAGKPTDSPASPSANWFYCHNEVACQNPVVGPAHEWKASNLGEVFGVALSDTPQQHIFVAASRAYGYATWPAGNGPGTVYRLNGNTGAITAFPQLPGAAGGTMGPGSGNSPDAALGNLCFVRTPNGTPWLYVTNLGDGKIYRMDPTGGANTAFFDHGLTALPQAPYNYAPVNDNPALVFTPEKRRPWGIGYFCGRLYYSVFDSADPTPGTGPQCEIWSLALDAGGNAVANSSVREFKTPPMSVVYTGFGPVGRTNMPVSDIEFTLAGAMILAERYHTACTVPYTATCYKTLPTPGWTTCPWNCFPIYLTGAHSTRALEYTGTSTAWLPSPQNKLRVGSAPWNNSAGGVGPACDGSVWCTGDALGVFGSTAAYGQQRISGQGNALDITPTLNSHIIDYDCNGAFYGKSLIGDVDTKIEPRRIIAKVVNAACPTVAGAPYTVTLSITNMLTVPLTQVGFGPCPPAFFPPPGAPTVQSLVPSPALYNFAPALAPYATQNITVTMNSLPAGGVKCFSIQGNPADFGGGGGAGSDGAFACSPKLCVNLPNCPCMSVATSNIQCPQFIGQDHSATITITNLWNVAADFWDVIPCPQNELPAGAITVQPNPAGQQPFSPQLGPGNTSPPLPLTFPGLPNTPTQVCFLVRLLTPSWEMEGPLCVFKLCINYPQCNPLPCVSGTLANIQCPTGPPGNYTASFTITNLGPIVAASAQLTPCAPVPGGVPAIPGPPFLNFLPSGLSQNQSITQTITLGGVGTSGVLACFCLTLFDSSSRPICSTVICQPLPPCPCATFDISNVTCPQYEGQPYTAVVTVTNTGWQPFNWISFSPCPQPLLPPGAIPGVGVGPAGLQPLLPPLNPGNSAPIPITLTGIPKAGGIICFNVGVFGQDEAHPLCQEKLCTNIAACPACLPCMNAIATAAQCPTVFGGPFTTTVSITNLQPVSAASAQLIPCAPGQLPPGGVSAIPLPGSVTFSPALGQNSSQLVNVGLTGAASGQLACFCVRLFDANGNLLCERVVCVTLPFCPPLCATISPAEVVCPQGGNGYFSFLNIFNQSGSTFAFYQTCPVPVGSLPAGALTGQPTPAGLTQLTPNIPNNGFGGAPVTLPNNLPTTGATFCFIIKFFGQMDNLICQQMVCLNLPPCQCGAILSHSVDCVPTPTGVKRQLTVTVQNLTNLYGTPFNFDVATIASAVGFSPAVVTPTPNPIPPGGTGTVTFCYYGNRPPQCVHILLTNSSRTLCCPLKLCPLWVECAQPETPDRCDLSSRIVADNALPVSTTAWIFNGSNTPKVYNFTITPVSVPGCSGTLPPVALQPASGTTLTVGAFSSLGIPFTINPSSLAPGQCAAFRVCFQEVSPVVVPPICCISKISRSNNTDVCVDWDPIGVGIPVGAGLKTIVIKNPTSAVMPVSLRLVQTGGVEFSLTGEFPSADGSAGGGGPTVDLDYLPIETELQPGQVMPITFTARVKAITFPGPGPGPVWAEWQLLKLCNVLPVNPVDPIDDPHTVASAVFHIPNATPTGPLPEDLRDFRFVPGGDPDFDTLSLFTTPGEILRPHASDDLHDFFPDWVLPYATVQGPDGSVAGTGQTLYASSPRPVSPGLQKLRRFFRWLQ